MIRMVKVKRQSVVFCKYTIAGLLWLAILLCSPIPVFLVMAVLAVSAMTGVSRAPLVRFYDVTFAKWFHTDEEYINMYSMRFAHVFAFVFCGFILISYYFVPTPLPALALAVILAVLQTIASLGFCSAAKLYDCLICNSNCCRVGKKIRNVRKNEK